MVVCRPLNVDDKTSDDYLSQTAFIESLFFPTQRRKLCCRQSSCIHNEGFEEFGALDSILIHGVDPSKKSNIHPRV